MKQNPAVSSSRAAHFVARLDMASPDPPLATRPIACPERSDTGFADANLDVGTAILLAVASANGQARAFRLSDTDWWQPPGFDTWCTASGTRATATPTT